MTARSTHYPPNGQKILSAKRNEKKRENTSHLALELTHCVVLLLSSRGGKQAYAGTKDKKILKSKNILHAMSA